MVLHQGPLKVIQNHSQLNFKKYNLVSTTLNYVEEGSWFNNASMGDLNRIIFIVITAVCQKFCASEQIPHLYFKLHVL